MLLITKINLNIQKLEDNLLANGIVRSMFADVDSYQKFLGIKTKKGLDEYNLIKQGGHLAALK